MGQQLLARAPEEERGGAERPEEVRWDVAPRLGVPSERDHRGGGVHLLQLGSEEDGQERRAVEQPAGEAAVTFTESMDSSGLRPVKSSAARR